MQGQILIVCAALAVTACAQEQQQTARTPPPPKSPWIEGEFKTVSSADIRAVVALMRQHIRKEYGMSLPIYRVHVIDRDNVSFQYWQHDTETWAYARRVKGRWQFDDAEAERVIVPGSNIPTG